MRPASTQLDGGAGRARIFRRLLAVALAACVVVALLYATASGAQLRAQLADAADSLFVEPAPAATTAMGAGTHWNWTALAAAAAHRCAAAALPTPLTPSPDAPVRTHWAVLEPGQLAQWLQRTDDAATAWTLVVVEVANANTSTTCSACRPPRCVYLSVAAQEALGYRVAALIPPTSAARVNIGFVYAIAHGARVLYDGVDVPTQRPLTAAALTVVAHASRHAQQQQQQQQEPTVYNVLAYFHAPSPSPLHAAAPWLRGLPLDLPAAQDGELAPADGLQVGVEQRLVAAPSSGMRADWDGMYRLLVQRRTPLRARLSSIVDAPLQRPPLVLGAGTFSPLSARRTLFHYDVLWAALLPASPPARVADIWRGYWAQRLLWDLGRHVLYYSDGGDPTAGGAATGEVTGPAAAKDDGGDDDDDDDAFQDFLDEAAVYRSAGQLVRLLDGWRATATDTDEAPSFFHRIAALTDELVAAGLWARTDAELTHAWLLDLLDACYTIPAPANATPTATAQAAPTVSATPPAGAPASATPVAAKWVVVVSEHARPPPGWLDNYCHLGANWTTLVVEHVVWANATEWEVEPLPTSPTSGCRTLTLGKQQETAWALGLAPGQAMTASLRRTLGHLHVLTRPDSRPDQTVVADLDARDRIRGGRVYELGDIVTNATAPDINFVRWRPAHAGHLLADVYGHFGWPGVRLPGTCLVAEAEDGAWAAYNATAQLAPLRGPVAAAAAPIVVQSLTDLSPDMDPRCASAAGPASAAQQFFHEQPGSRRFCADVPAVQLDAGLFGLLNARNTVFYPPALPLLWLPWLAPADRRRADLLRGFLVQRLLWDTGHRLVLQPPTTELDPAFNATAVPRTADDGNGATPSSSLASAAAAAPMKAEPDDDWTPLLRFLRRWTSRTTAAAAGDTDPWRQIELVDALVGAGHLAPVNRVLVRTWHARLAGPFPPPAAAAPAATDSAAVLGNNTADAVLPFPPQDGVLADRLDRCAWRWRWAPTLHPTFRSIIVGVHFNRPHMETLRTYVDLYAPAFPDMVFWGLPPAILSPRLAPPYDMRPYLVPASSDNGGWGWLQHRALVAMVDAFPTYAGYLHTNDDTFVDYWRLAQHDQRRPWFPIALDPAQQGRFDIVSEGGHHNGSRWHWFSHIRMMQTVLHRLPCWAFRGSYSYLHAEHLLAHLSGGSSSAPNAVGKADAADSECVNPFSRLTGGPGDANITTPTEFNFFNGRSDFVYIPASSSSRLTELWRGAMVLLMMEIAIPSALLFTFGNLTNTAIQFVNITYGEGFRPPWSLANDPVPLVDGYHPAKLGDAEAVVISHRALVRSSAIALRERARP